MEELIIKSCGYVLLILLGYLLKKAGIFHADMKDMLGKVLMYVTLPFAFIANFRSFQAGTALFLYFLLGLLANILLMGIGRLLAGRRGGEEKALYMIECSGYNIGAFATPFISSVLPQPAALVSSMFDIGNSIMSIGVVYPLARYEAKAGFILKKLFGSVPFDTYLAMLLISLAGVRLPDAVSNVASAFGAPSILLTMLMIGIAFEVKISRKDLGDILKILGVRSAGAVLLLICFWLLPGIGAVEKQALSMCVFAPVTSISANYCGMCGCRPEAYGAVSSLSVVISLLVYSILFI